MNTPNRSVSILRRLVDLWPTLRDFVVTVGRDTVTLVRATVIEATGYFSINGNQGQDGASETFLTDMQLSGGTIQIKTRSVAYSGGIVTEYGAESGWTDVAGGADGAVTVVTALQDNAGTIEYKTRALTYDNGIVTTIGAESGWTST